MSSPTGVGLPLSVRIALSTAAEAYVHRWLWDNLEPAERLAIDELFKIFANVYELGAVGSK